MEEYEYMTNEMIIILLTYLKANYGFNIILEAKDLLTITISLSDNEEAEEFVQFYNMNTEVSYLYPILSLVDDVVIIGRGTPQF